MWRIGGLCRAVAAGGAEGVGEAIDAATSAAKQAIVNYIALDKRAADRSARAFFTTYVGMVHRNVLFRIFSLYGGKGRSGLENAWATDGRAEAVSWTWRASGGLSPHGARLTSRFS